MTHPAGVVIATNGHDSMRDRQLLAQGATLLDLPSTETGQIDLGALLRSLAQLGIRSVMVEGGAAVIDSFLRPTGRLSPGDRRAHVPGRRPPVGAATPMRGRDAAPRLADVRTQTLGDDIIISGVPTWARRPSLKADAMPAMSTPSPRRSLYFVAPGKSRCAASRALSPHPTKCWSPLKSPPLAQAQSCSFIAVKCLPTCAPTPPSRRWPAPAPIRSSTATPVWAGSRRWAMRSTRRGTGAPSSPSSPTSPISPPGRRS
ncbi:MAG: dihydrofolate reductase family protein [Caldilineaceae bacterium]